MINLSYKQKLSFWADTNNPKNNPTRFDGKRSNKKDVFEEYVGYTAFIPRYLFPKRPPGDTNTWWEQYSKIKKENPKLIGVEIEKWQKEETRFHKSFAQENYYYKQYIEDYLKIAKFDII